VLHSLRITSNGFDPGGLVTNDRTAPPTLVVAMLDVDVAAFVTEHDTADNNLDDDNNMINFLVCG
jgi:hypothetical protein